MINDDLLEELSELVGIKVEAVEIVSICHMLRLFFSNGLSIDFCGNWRIRSDKSTVFGALNMDFLFEFSEEEIEKADKKYTKKARSIVGKKILTINSTGNDIFFELSGNRFLDVFDLSSDGINSFIRRG